MQPRGVDTPLFLQSRIAMRNIPLTNRLLAVNTIVKNRNGEVSSCDIPYSRNLSEFNHNYLKLTKQVKKSCRNHDLSDYMVIGTSAIIDTEIDGAHAGLF